MTKVLDYYKGVILFFLVIVLFGFLISDNVKKLNNGQINQVNTYEIR